MTTAIPSISINPLTPVTPPPESMTFPKPTTTTLPTPHLKRKPDDLNLDLGERPSKIPNQVPEPPPTAQIPPLDPRYIAMVSRVAAFYQQRSQAVASIQQQRCQAWANVQRQKCHEMMQAATLVVAWYIRDRISRRRRKDKRKFRTGLQQKNSRVQKAPKGQIVRRWVMAVPEATVAPESPPDVKLIDPEEAHFNIDEEQTPDKDSKLFEMADHLIRSQYRKIEVPLFGALDLAESDAESDDTSDRMEDPDDDEDEPAAGRRGRDDMDDDGEDDEDLFEDDDDDDDDELMSDYPDDEEQLGSELVQDGTGHASRRNIASLVGS